MKQQIKHHWNDKVLFECELDDNTENPMREAVIKAVASKANLSKANLSKANLSGAYLSKADLSRAYMSGADLSEADLSEADLSEAYLSGADLSKANLSKANLSRADLSRAYLSGADLSEADLSEAYLSGADLSGADLSGADLSGVDLSGADLSGADLSGADLSGADLSWATLDPIKADFWMILLSAPFEVAGLRLALIEGRVDGSTYEGDCACLVGTIANVRHASYKELGIKPDSTRAAERWFMGIKKGDTPETNQVSKITVKWLDEFTSKLVIANGETTYLLIQGENHV
jgi:Pentapeptide repeats (8 copies)